MKIENLYIVSYILHERSDFVQNTIHMSLIFINLNRRKSKVYGS